MDKNLVLNAARTYIPDEKKPLPADKLKISPDAVKAVDTDNNSQISQQELYDGLLSNKVQIDEKTKSINVKGGLEDPNQFSFTIKPRNEADKPVEARGTAYQFQELAAFNTGSYEKPYQPVSALTRSPYNEPLAKALVGRSFSDVAQMVTTPYDIAVLIGKGITYEDDRANKGTGTPGTYSPQEVLTKGTGVCRDSHALALALLKEKGYEAKMFGYPAADGTFHAYTVYQDPHTKKWGAIEYDNVYPPETLLADSPEEAFVKVRPDAFVLYEFNGDKNPEKGMHEVKIHYTPTARAFASFALGHYSGNFTTTISNTHSQVSGKTDDGKWEYAMRYNHPNEMTPSLDNSFLGGIWYNSENLGLRTGIGAGFMPEMFSRSIGKNNNIDLPTGIIFATTEGRHNILGFNDIAGSGVNLNLNSKFAGITALGLNKSGDQKDDKGNLIKENENMVIDAGVTQGLSRFNWTPDISADTRLNLWGGEGKDTNIFASYGADFDAVLSVYSLRSGGPLPVTQYFTAGADTRLPNGLSFASGLYIPVSVHSNEYNREPMLNVSLGTEFVNFSTTQSINNSVYSLEGGADITNEQFTARVDGAITVEHDRRNNNLIPGFETNLSFNI